MNFHELPCSFHEWTSFFLEYHMPLVTWLNNQFFIAPLLKIRFSVPAKRVETAIFNPRCEALKVGLQSAVSTCSTGTENQILKTVAMKNSTHYSKQNTAIANFTLVCSRCVSSLVMQYIVLLLGHQTSHSQNNFFFPGSTIYYWRDWMWKIFSPIEFPHEKQYRCYVSVSHRRLVCNNEICAYFSKF